LIPEPLLDDVPAGFIEGVFTVPVLLPFATPVSRLCRSRRLSSAPFLLLLVVPLGSGTDDLRGGCAADFGVSGLVAVLRGSCLGEVEDGASLEFCALASPIKAATVTNKIPILGFNLI
jgi:hypothetical protein